MSQRIHTPWIIRIVWSNHIISPSEIWAVLQRHDTRIAVEHILSLLNHKNHPGSTWDTENYSPKSFIHSPQNALSTLDILFEWHESIFDTRDSDTTRKIVLSIIVLLSEFYGNQELYNPSIWRSPEEQKSLYIAQQRLTDAFHFITWSIIDNSFQVKEQFWDIQMTDIQQTDEILDKITKWNDFPNIRKILKNFRHINFD